MAPIVRWLQRSQAFIERFRTIPVRCIAFGSLVLSIVVVAAHIPGRWNGERTAEDADIPLRPLPAEEAAALLTANGNGGTLARIVRFAGNEVVIETGVYLLPNNAPRGECFGPIVYERRSYQVCSSSWESYHNVHVVNRAALEHQLARRLTERDLTADRRSESRASFSSNRLPFYFAVEVAFLTTFLAAFASIVCFVRKPLFIPPLILLTNVSAMMFVPFYSPAFIDADWFYQRIAVEELIGGRGPLGATFRVVMVASVALSAITLPLYLLIVIARCLRRVTGFSDVRTRAMMAMILIGALAIQLAVERQRYNRDHEQVNLALRRLQSALDASSVETMRADPAMQSREVNLWESGALKLPTRQVVDRVLSSRAPLEELRVFVPLEHGWYLYLSSTPQYRYVDVRQLRSGAAAVIDHDVVEVLLRTGEPYEASFRTYLASSYLAGRAFHTEGNRVVAVALVGSMEPDPKPTAFRWWWRLIDG